MMSAITIQHKLGERSMTTATANESIDPITDEDYERIMQMPQQARAGESPEQATLLRATSIAAIGLMRDAMLTTTRPQPPVGAT